MARWWSITMIRRTAAILLVLALCSVAQAQITCNTYGNTTTCNGLNSGPDISPLPFTNFGASQAQAQNAQAQAQLAQAQAELARQQAEAIRLQNEAVQQQQFLAQVSSASDDGLQSAMTKLTDKRNSFGCRISADCRDQVDWALGAVSAEISRREQARFAAGSASPPKPTAQSFCGELWEDRAVLMGKMQDEVPHSAAWEALWGRVGVVNNALAHCQ
jgi:hypothetical protein